MGIAIETHQLTKAFEQRSGWRSLTRKNAIRAVSAVDLSIPEGELFGLLGPNGAGKTTLVKMLATLILPSSGDAYVAGHPLGNGRAVRAAVGLVVSDERSFFWRLSAQRNLRFFAALHGLHDQVGAARIREVLSQVDLLDDADKRFSDYSAGMRQQLAIARSLLHRPQILFLDEPSRSLDPIATQRLHDLLRQTIARQGLTILLITHDLSEAEALCQRVALMHRGRIRAIGQPEELRRRLRPSHHYTVTTTAIEGESLAELQANIPGLICRPVGQQHQIQFQSSEEDGLLTAVIDWLRESGHSVQAVTDAPATLEEVFAHFTGEPLQSGPRG